MGFLGSLLAVAAALVPGSMAAAPPDPRTGTGIETALAGDWIVEAADNVCGLTDPRQISNPAELDYDELLRATPEMKEMKRKGIDKDSPEGQVLYNKAVDRVQSAAARVMKDKGYDSVWKKVRHRQGRKAPSITDAVKDKLEEVAST